MSIQDGVECRRVDSRSNNFRSLKTFFGLFLLLLASDFWSKGSKQVEIYLISMYVPSLRYILRSKYRNQRKLRSIVSRILKEVEVQNDTW